MSARRSATWRWLGTVVVVLAAAPLVYYWQAVSRWPSVTAAEAREMSWRLEDPAALVDVRGQKEFEADHLIGAESWPLAEVTAVKAGDAVLKRYAGKTVLIMSESGLDGGAAVARLGTLGVKALAVEGGMEGWMAAARKPCASALAMGGQDADAMERTFYFRPTPRYEQWAVVVASLIVKPLYMLTALALIIALWRRKEADLAALRWGLVCFLVGETACASNYLVFDNGSMFVDYIHNAVMPMAFAFTAYAMLEGIDRRLIRYGDDAARCAAAELCGTCEKHSGAACGLQRVFLILIPAMMVISLMPLAVKTRMVSYNTGLFGVVYSYNHPVAHQLYEIRYLPVVAVGFFAAALAVLAAGGRRGVPLSKVLYSAGLGAFGFSMLRTILYTAYRDDLAWAQVWEEGTEIMYAAGAALVLWVFRKGLFTRETVEERVASGPAA